MISFVTEHIFPAAFSLLPEKMDTPEARAMLLAIGLQESRFEHRVQIRGPAHGYWQFERGGGVRGVLRHPASETHAKHVCSVLNYRSESDEVYRAIVDNDILACCFARLLLWTLPGSLPGAAESGEGWRQYIEAWRPGKPHRETWDGFYEQAWTYP